MENISQTNKCKECYYSRPAVAEGLMFCSYVADVMALDGNKDGYDMELAESLVTTIGFKGEVFEAFVDMLGDTTEPVLAPVVSENGICLKHKAPKE